MLSWAEFLETIVFVMPSLLSAAALGVAASVAGLFVLLRRQSLVALALPQVVAVGVAVGLRFAWPTLLPAAVAVLVVIILLSRARSANRAQALLGAVYIGSLSVAMLLIANAGQHFTEMQNRFVGVDVAVDWVEAGSAGPVLLLAGALCAVLWRRWLLLAQAPAVAELAGLRAGWWDLGFYLLLAGIVLIGTNTLGVVMVLAMLFLPGATVLPWAGRIPQAMLLCMLASLLFLAAGVTLSTQMEWPLSHSVGGVGFAVMLGSRGVAALQGR
jgi:ABC-type Mn2+/Zn2+ transport system permease subunit